MPRDKGLRLAILYDEHSKYSPSNLSAIHNFCRAAIQFEISPTIIQKHEIDTLHNFDALFVRDTTHLSDYPFEFITYAEMLGMKVIDNSISVMQGCNKIWQINQFNELKIPHPSSSLIYRHNPVFPDEYPCVIKTSDSSFSKGVFKANNRQEALKIISELKNPQFICQEFIQSDFDWRIGIFNHKFLYAVKYYMAPDDFRVIKYDRQGNLVEGNHECVVFEDIPPCVLTAAFKCDQLLTDGLYGLDIKEVEGKAYVIEINDNPSIDAGVEDEIEGDNIYEAITRWYVE